MMKLLATVTLTTQALLGISDTADVEVHDTTATASKSAVATMASDEMTTDSRDFFCEMFGMC